MADVEGLASSAKAGLVPSSPMAEGPLASLASILPLSGRDLVAAECIQTVDLLAFLQSKGLSFHDLSRFASVRSHALRLEADVAAPVPAGPMLLPRSMAPACGVPVPPLGSCAAKTPDRSFLQVVAGSPVGTCAAPAPAAAGPSTTTLSNVNFCPQSDSLTLVDVAGAAASGFVADFGNISNSNSPA